MTYSILNTASSQQLPPPFDTVSQIYGDMTGLTFCGPRTIEITGDPAIYSDFITITSSIGLIEIETSDESLVGLYTLEARIFL